LAAEIIFHVTNLKNEKAMLFDHVIQVPGASAASQVQDSEPGGAEACQSGQDAQAQAPAAAKTFAARMAPLLDIQSISSGAQAFLDDVGALIGVEKELKRNFPVGSINLVIGECSSEIDAIGTLAARAVEAAEQTHVRIVCPPNPTRQSIMEALVLAVPGYGSRGRARLTKAGFVDAYNFWRASSAVRWIVVDRSERIDDANGTDREAIWALISDLKRDEPQRHIALIGGPGLDSWAAQFDVACARRLYSLEQMAPDDECSWISFLTPYVESIDFPNARVLLQPSFRKALYRVTNGGRGVAREIILEAMLRAYRSPFPTLNFSDFLAVLGRRPGMGNKHVADA